MWKYSFFTTVLFETRKFPFFLFSKWKQKLFNDLFEVAQNAFNWILMNSFALLLPYYVGRWSTFHNVGLGTKIIINDIEVEILIECRVLMHILAYGGPALFLSIINISSSCKLSFWVLWPPKAFLLYSQYPGNWIIIFVRNCHRFMTAWSGKWNH